MTLSLLLACASEPTAPHDTGSELPANRAPGAPSVELSSERPLYGEDLGCLLVEEAVDPDGDAVSYFYSWTVDGAEVGAWQRWACTVVASDGTDDSPPATASATTLDECIAGEFLGSQGVMPLLQSYDDLALDVDGGPFTIEGWFKLDAVTSTLFYKGVADSGMTSVNLDYALLSVEGTDLHWATGWSGTGDCDYRVVEEVTTPGTWHHVAATADTDTGEKALFIDGVLVDSCQMHTKNPGGDGPLTIGAHVQISNGQAYPSSWLVGLIDEVRISSTVRYVEDFEPSRWHEPDDDTLLLYHFAEGAGMSLEDASGNGYEGQFIYASWSEDDSACEAP